jgi:formylglycine-generating enzyme required for sulfatase activity
MVSIRAGDFKMGSLETETDSIDQEYPQHKVHISAFEVSRLPVRRGQWRLYADDTGHGTSEGCHWFDSNKDWRNPGFPQDDTHPVVCVTWQETQDYIAWLNRKSGQHFRLLTEAEYEYVNRAGTQTAYFWGDSDADLEQHASRNDKGTTPAGSFPANPWGLFDTTGNVWSWTRDCWHANYNGAPTDGSAWETRCSSPSRVVRGGAWYNRDAWLRSAYRGHYLGGDGGIIIGFRLARTQ